MYRRAYSTLSGVCRGHSGANKTLTSSVADVKTIKLQTLQQYTKPILSETKVSQQHLTPELRLRLITPECRLFHEPLTPETTRIFENDPFWGFYWPGGQALSRYILDNPQMVAHKTLLDVGSGCGASALAALKCNAKHVVANDIDAVAGCAAWLNAELNELPLDKLHISVENLIDNMAQRPEDIVLIGDLFYDEEFAVHLLPWLRQLHAAGKQILIGDPGRHGLTENRLRQLRKLATYELTPNCCIENNGFKFVHVWQFQ